MQAEQAAIFVETAEANSYSAKQLSCSETGGCKKGCCSTEFTYFQNDQDLQIQDFDFKKLKKPVSPTAIIPSPNLSFSIFEINSSTFLSYKPPIAERDIPVLFQSFLL